MVCVAFRVVVVVVVSDVVVLLSTLFSLRNRCAMSLIMHNGYALSTTKIEVLFLLLF